MLRVTLSVGHHYDQLISFLKKRSQLVSVYPISIWDSLFRRETFFQIKKKNNLFQLPYIFFLSIAHFLLFYYMKKISSWCSDRFSAFYEVILGIVDAVLRWDLINYFFLLHNQTRFLQRLCIDKKKCFNIFLFRKPLSVKDYSPVVPPYSQYLVSAFKNPLEV